MEVNEDLKKEYIEALKEYQVEGDVENDHLEADNLLCELLTRLGYSDVVKEWEKVYKWYA